MFRPQCGTSVGNFHKIIILGTSESRIQRKPVQKGWLGVLGCDRVRGVTIFKLTLVYMLCLPISFTIRRNNVVSTSTRQHTLSGHK